MSSDIMGMLIDPLPPYSTAVRKSDMMAGCTAPADPLSFTLQAACKKLIFKCARISNAGGLLR
jgi:hypothetical protein